MSVQTPLIFFVILVEFDEFHMPEKAANQGAQTFPREHTVFLVHVEGWF